MHSAYPQAGAGRRSVEAASRRGVNPVFIEEVIEV